jgi:hypothetical protein
VLARRSFCHLHAALGIVPMEGGLFHQTRPFALDQTNPCGPRIGPIELPSSEFCPLNDSNDRQ